MIARVARRRHAETGGSGRTSEAGERPHTPEQHAQLVRQRRVGRLSRGRLGVTNEIPPGGDTRQLATQHLAQAALYAIAYHRSAHALAGDDPHACGRRLASLAYAGNRDEQAGGAPAALPRPGEIAR